MALETLTVDRPNCPLDLLLLRRLGREVEGLVEDTYGRNPGLAALPAILPIGTRVDVMIPEAPAALPRRAVVTLWT